MDLVVWRRIALGLTQLIVMYPAQGLQVQIHRIESPTHLRTALHTNINDLITDVGAMKGLKVLPLKFSILLDDRHNSHKEQILDHYWHSLEKLLALTFLHELQFSAAQSVTNVKCSLSPLTTSISTLLRQGAPAAPTQVHTLVRGPLL